jgi:hypothetical protein
MAAWTQFNKQHEPYRKHDEKKDRKHRYGKRRD